MNLPSNNSFLPYNFEKLKAISDLELRYANGFLRSNPLRWIGSIKNHWSAILESAGADLRLIELKTTVDVDFNQPLLWAAQINNYPIAVGCDSAAIEVICNLAAKNVKHAAKSVALDYFGRRLLGTLAMSWNGPALEGFSYVPIASVAKQQWAAAINVRIEISGQLISFSYLLSAYILDVLDGLWLRQRLAAAKKQGELLLNLELADLEVSQDELPNYLRSGAVVTFPGGNFESAHLVSRGENVIFGGKLVQIGDHLGVRVLSGNKAITKTAADRSRLSFVLAQVKINAEKYAEVSQPGAILKTELPLMARVAILANGVKQAEGQLGFQSGQAVIQVL